MCIRDRVDVMPPPRELVPELRRDDSRAPEGRVARDADLHAFFPLSYPRNAATGSASVGGTFAMKPSAYSTFAILPSARDLSLIHISEPTRLGMISYAVFCLKK